MPEENAIRHIESLLENLCLSFEKKLYFVFSQSEKEKKSDLILVDD